MGNFHSGDYAGQGQASPFALHRSPLTRLTSSGRRRARLIAGRPTSADRSALTVFKSLTEGEKRLIKHSWKHRARTPATSLSFLEMAAMAAFNLVADPFQNADEHAQLNPPQPSSKRKVSPTVLNALVEILSKTRCEFWASLQTTASTVDELYGCPRVRAHAANVEKFIDWVVQQLNTAGESRCAARIGQVGRHHTSFPVLFDAETWLIFKRSIVRHASANQPAATAMVWTKFVGCLIKEMKRGFLDEVREKHSLVAREKDLQAIK